MKHIGGLVWFAIILTTLGCSESDRDSDFLTIKNLSDYVVKVGVCCSNTRVFTLEPAQTIQITVLEVTDIFRDFLTVNYPNGAHVQVLGVQNGDVITITNSGVDKS